MDFNEYCKNNKKSCEKSNASYENIKEENKKDIKDLYDKYSGYSHDQLMQELLHQTASKKADGSLSNEKLLEIQKKLTPFLNDTQSKNLKDIIERLK